MPGSAETQGGGPKQEAGRGQTEVDLCLGPQRLEQKGGLQPVPHLQGWSFPKQRLCCWGPVFWKLGAHARMSAGAAQLSDPEQRARRSQGAQGLFANLSCILLPSGPFSRVPPARAPSLIPRRVPGLGGSPWGPAGGGHQQSPRVRAPLGPQESLPPSSAFIGCKSVISFLCGRKMVKKLAFTRRRRGGRTGLGTRFWHLRVGTASWSSRTALRGGRRGRGKPGGQLGARHRLSWPSCLEDLGGVCPVCSWPADREGPGTRTLAHGAPMELLALRRGEGWPRP